MGFKCGIVGPPNVGKSTLFNALTHAGVDAANYPFCTIEPNIGMVPVPDQRLQALADIAHPKKIIPAVVEFVDIAGLVKGAADGEGLGNQFLSHIRHKTQAIAHVVRCFEQEDITHVSGKIDPQHDIDTTETELALSDLEVIEKQWIKLGKNRKKGLPKESVSYAELLTRLKDSLNKGIPLRTLSFTDQELELMHPLQLITLKPVLYVANTDEAGLTEGNVWIDQVKSIADRQSAEMITICAAIESDMLALTTQEQQDFLQMLGLKESGLNRFIHAGYRLLKLETFFTAGSKEVRAWTISHQTTASAAAGVIHTDFEKGFIRAEVIGFKDYIQYQGEQGAKNAGRWRQEGRDYVVRDGDVILFRFNV
jgi:GTP-binding protein YchF